MRPSTGVQTVSKALTPLGRNRVLEAGYYQQRADEAAAKREASKAKRKSIEERLRAIAKDLRTMKVAEVQKKWQLGYSGLANAQADILLNRY